MTPSKAHHTKHGMYNAPACEAIQKCPNADSVTHLPPHTWDSQGGLCNIGCNNDEAMACGRQFKDQPLRLPRQHGVQGQDVHRGRASRIRDRWPVWSSCGKNDKEVSVRNMIGVRHRMHQASDELESHGLEYQNNLTSQSLSWMQNKVSAVFLMKIL